MGNLNFLARKKESVLNSKLNNKKNINQLFSFLRHKEGNKGYDGERLNMSS